MSQNSIPAAKPLKWRGKLLIGTPIGVGEIFEHSNYCRMLYLEDAKKQLEGLPSAIQMGAWKDAKAFADRMVPGSDEYGLVANWLDAQIYLVWLTFRTKQPDMTIENVKEALTEQYPDFVALANEMAGFKAAEESPLAQGAEAAK